MTTLGGISEMQPKPNSAGIEDLSSFAVEEHNKKENALLHFSRFEKKEVAMMNMMRLKNECQPHRRPITTYARE